MFTGLVEEMGVVKGIDRGAHSIKLTIAAMIVLTDVKIGDSIAVNGTCLTVVDFQPGCFTADVMPETMSKSSLGQLQIGQRVNLERALKLGDRLGGHIVSGHIDGVGVIRSKQRNDIAIVVTIEAPDQILRYVIPKGSIAIDGVSLTVVSVDTRQLTVSLIPHSAGSTTLGLKKPGDIVNLEGDVLGKYVERLLQPQQPDTVVPSGLTVDFLQRCGFHQ